MDEVNPYTKQPWEFMEGGKSVSGFVIMALFIIQFLFFLTRIMPIIEARRTGKPVDSSLDLLGASLVGLAVLAGLWIYVRKSKRNEITCEFYKNAYIASQGAAGVKNVGV